MGDKSAGTTTTSSSNQPPADVLAAYDSLIKQGQQVAAIPYTPYTGQQVADLTPTQTLGIQNVSNAAGTAQPYINQASNLALQSAQPISQNIPQYNSQNLQQYQDPYQQSVINATQANLNQNNAIQQNQLKGQAIASGASPFGGDRAGVAAAELARNQNLANNQTIAGLQSQGFQNAQQEFNTQQQTQLSAQQADAARQAQASYLEGGLGTQAQTAGIQGGEAQIQAGGVQQQQAQNELNVPYQQYLQQQAYPFATTQFLGNLVEGIGANSGGSGTTTQNNQVPILGLAGGGKIDKLASGGFGSVSWIPDNSNTRHGPGPGKAPTPGKAPENPGTDFLGGGLQGYANSPGKGGPGGLLKTTGGTTPSDLGSSMPWLNGGSTGSSIAAPSASDSAVLGSSAGTSAEEAGTQAGIGGAEAAGASAAEAGTAATEAGAAGGEAAGGAASGIMAIFAKKGGKIGLAKFADGGDIGEDPSKGEDAIIVGIDDVSGGVNVQKSSEGVPWIPANSPVVDGSGPPKPPSVGATPTNQGLDALVAAAKAAASAGGKRGGKMGLAKFADGGTDEDTPESYQVASESIPYLGYTDDTMTPNNTIPSASDAAALAQAHEELDSKPVIDHSGDTTKIHYPNEEDTSKRTLDLGLPSPKGAIANTDISQANVKDNNNNWVLPLIAGLGATIQNRNIGSGLVAGANTYSNQKAAQQKQQQEQVQMAELVAQRNETARHNKAEEGKAQPITTYAPEDPTDPKSRLVPTTSLYNPISHDIIKTNLGALAGKNGVPGQGVGAIDTAIRQIMAENPGLSYGDALNRYKNSGKGITFNNGAATPIQGYGESAGNIANQTEAGKQSAIVNSAANKAIEESSGKQTGEAAKTVTIMQSNLPAVMQRLQKMREAAPDASSGFGVDEENNGIAQQFAKSSLGNDKTSQANALLRQYSTQGILPELGPQLQQAGVRGNKFLESLASAASGIDLAAKPADKIALANGLETTYVNNYKAAAQQLRQKGLPAPSDAEIDAQYAELKKGQIPEGMITPQNTPTMTPKQAEIARRKAAGLM